MSQIKIKLLQDFAGRKAGEVFPTCSMTARNLYNRDIAEYIDPGEAPKLPAAKKEMKAPKLPAAKKERDPLLD